MSEEQNNNNLTEDGEDLQEALAKKESDLCMFYVFHFLKKKLDFFN